MSDTRHKPALYLCGGLQSSGSTLVSWCFLQRRDMDGYLDADNDILKEIPRELGKPSVWYKTTISSFRLSELAAHYRDEGWDVRPLLLVRDVRHVWNSLVGKSYGRNGTTAEDPPLRLRLRRFKDDWEHFRREQWAILRYESFLADPEQALRRACSELQLPWDPSMLSWSKQPEEIADMKHGNQTFHASRGTTLQATLKPARAVNLRHILPADLRWLEIEFEEFNSVNGYPTVASGHDSTLDSSTRSIPCFSVSRRSRLELRRKPLRWMVAGLRRLLPRKDERRDLSRPAA